MALGNSPDAFVSPGVGDGGIGAPQLPPAPLGLGAHRLQPVCAELVREGPEQSSLSAPAARSHHSGSAEAGSLQARCSGLIGLEESGRSMALALLLAVDFHEALGSGFSETFEVVPNHPGTSQSVQKFF